MKKIIYIPVAAFMLLLAISSCKKDPVIDGGLSIAKVNMSTYDYLKSNSRHLFDTTLLIVDKAGMKDMINGPGTFFVPDDYAIASYLAAKQNDARKIDERKNFTIDTLFKYYSAQMLKDSMGIYFFPLKLSRDELSANGVLYQTSTPNIKLMVSLEENADDYQVDGIISTKPKYIYLTKIRGEKDLVNSNGTTSDPSGNPQKLDIKVLCQTTGIITNNGIIHVLSNQHTWTFKQ
ncbi:hypothetical protein AB6735_11585 [Mucilaginibacter sp. RCC_168]|uniref:hypothetical protein n=1 Tax=Mucilaginibacter sp. RCC_168 TaxID=3239221 RepID=UPI003524DBD4